MPEVVYADGLAPTARDFITFQLTANPAASGSQGACAFMAADAATQPSTQPVTAKADASVPGGDFRIQKVTFDATDHSHYHPIAKDDGTGNYDGSWYDANGNGKLDEGDHFDPICYTRTTTGSAKNGSGEKPVDGGVYYKLGYCIIGKGVAGQQYAVAASELFGSKLYTMKGVATFRPDTGGNGSGTLQGILTSVGVFGVSELPGVFSLKLDWTVSEASPPTVPDAGTTTRPTTAPRTIDAGSTTDLEYVSAADPLATPTAATPIPALSNSAIFETVLEVGCAGARGKSKPIDVRDGIWALTATLSVQSVDGTVMKFDHTSSSPMQFTTAFLVATKKGPCGAWAHFLRDVFLAQGIVASGSEVTAGNLNPKHIVSVSGIIVHQAPAQGSLGAVYIPPLNPQFFPSTPSTAFNDHAVVEVTIPGIGPSSHRVYDPSYGNFSDDSATGINARIIWAETNIIGFVWSPMRSDQITSDYIDAPAPIWNLYY